MPQDRGNSATDCYFLHDPNTAATRQMAPPATSHSNVSAGRRHQRYTDVNQGGLPANTDSHRSSSFIPCCEMPIPTPMTYDGNTKWSAFVCSFENMSRAYQWSQEEMVHRMLTSLRGDAHEFVFTSLSQQERSDYFMLRKAIQNRFQPRYTEDDYISKLENLKLRERDNVTSFTAMLKHLVSKAYPMVDGNAQEKLSLRYFFSAVEDDDAKFTVKWAKPKSLAEAEQLFVDYQHCKPGGRVKRPVRALQAEGSEDSSGRSQVDVLKKEIQEGFSALSSTLKELLLDKKNIADNRVEKKQYRRQTRDMSQVECYKCHGFGHYARECSARGNERGSHLEVGMGTHMDNDRQ